MGLDLARIFSSDSSSMVSESRRTAELARRLLAIRADLLDDDGEQARLESLAAELEAAASAADGRLVMGLLGGTGVGKSTLISALAGYEISASGVVRPITSQPIIYRHKDFRALSDWAGLEVVHDSERLRNLAIIDLPDFDSLETRHHQIVNQSLAGLDLVVWLTDNHKYADRRLYEVMAQVQGMVADSAQIFLLNKADELLARPDGTEALNYVLSDLAEQLAVFGGWLGPRPWPVSAAEALAAPANGQAGGLAPLYELLDSLADAKHRRAVESGNLETKRRHLVKQIEGAARPEKWLEQLESLKTLQKNFSPEAAVQTDLALLTLARPSYLAPRLEALKKQASGLLALFTDGWDFVNRLKPTPDTPPAPPEPQAMALARTLAGAGEDLRLITGRALVSPPDNLNQTGGNIIQKALAANFKDPKVSSFLLLAWPVALAFILVWAETGGQYGGPAALIAAILRSAAPWTIFSFLGDLILSRFIWFRAQRKYESDFQRALHDARASLLELAENQVGRPLANAIDQRTGFLNLLADLVQAKKRGGHLIQGPPLF